MPIRSLPTQVMSEYAAPPPLLDQDSIGPGFAFIDGSAQMKIVAAAGLAVRKKKNALAVTHDLGVALGIGQIVVVMRSPHHAAVFRNVYLTSAAAPARIDHPRAVSQFDDLALVALLDRLTESLPRLAVVIGIKKRIPVADMDDRVKKRSVLRLNTRAGRKKDESALVPGHPERPFGKRYIGGNIAGPGPCSAVVERFLDIKTVNVVIPFLPTSRRCRKEKSSWPLRQR